MIFVCSVRRETTVEFGMQESKNLFCADRSGSGDSKTTAVSGGEREGDMGCAGAFWDGVER